MLAEGEQVATKKNVQRTCTGEFGWVPATGKRISLQYVDIMRIPDGRIVEHGHCVNHLDWLQQLGLVPAYTTASG